MRCTYGPDQPYTAFAARALGLWTKYEKKWKRKFLHRSGVLWMVSSRDDGYERGSIAVLREAGVDFQELTKAEMKKRWPQVNFEGVHWGIFEPKCGYLDARASCRAVAEEFVTAGGKYRQIAVLPHGLEDAPQRAIQLSDGSEIKGDAYVFACGPWLRELFPETIGNLMEATKQEIFFFGPPAGDSRFGDMNLPVWGDHGERFFYGIPGNDCRGFKVADDTRGGKFDPTNGERMASEEGLQRVRKYIDFRFPAMKGAPLIETRVCQYEQTADSDFIVDRHPRMDNVWLLGGGSGHGFKHGPALGKMMAELVLNDGEGDSRWRLARFSDRQKG